MLLNLSVDFFSLLIILINLTYTFFITVFLFALFAFYFFKLTYRNSQRNFCIVYNLCMQNVCVCAYITAGISFQHFSFTNTFLSVKVLLIRPTPLQINSNNLICFYRICFMHSYIMLLHY